MCTKQICLDCYGETGQPVRNPSSSPRSKRTQSSQDARGSLPSSPIAAWYEVKLSAADQQVRKSFNIHSRVADWDLAWSTRDGCGDICTAQNYAVICRARRAHVFKDLASGKEINQCAVWVEEVHLYSKQSAAVWVERLRPKL